jgi:hypothetical protein
VEVLSPNCRSFACAAQGLSNASIEVGNLTLWVTFDRSCLSCLPVHVPFAP